MSRKYADDYTHYCVKHEWSKPRDGNYLLGYHTPHCVNCGIKGERQVLAKPDSEQGRAK